MARLRTGAQRAALGVALGLVAATLGFGCTSGDGEGGSASDAGAGAEGAPDADGALIVYSGRGDVLVGPLFEMFEEQSGLDVEVRYGSTPDLANRLALEGAETPCDVFFAQDSGYLGALAANELLAELPADLAKPLDPRFQGVGTRWLPTSGRARVLVYNPERVKPEELPGSLKALADPRWKGRLGWAPQNGSFQAHVSALRHIWGEPQTREWLESIHALAPNTYPKNGPQVVAAASGEIDLGWVNHYYVHKMKSSDPGLKAANWSFPADGDAGNVLMLSGAGISAHAKRPHAARRLLEFLVSDEAQTFFAKRTFEYPTRAGTATHPDVPPLAALKPIQVDQAHLTDLEPTLKMLADLGLL